MKKECLAMLLAGGEGRRLGSLTEKLAKPAVPFGGVYRIIDFTLSNCSNSGIDTVGIMTQFHPLALNHYIGNGSAWGLDRRAGGVTILPPFAQQGGGKWYSGTANAVFQNIDYIEQYDPEFLLVLSGDHVYKMDYSAMLEEHKARKSELSIAVTEVSWDEANQFGTLGMDADCRVLEFEEKSKQPKSNLASMGVYIFNWKMLKNLLRMDEYNLNSSHDFGKDVIPLALKKSKKIYGYCFSGYWKDVGTVSSLWRANMDLLEENSQLDLSDASWRIYNSNPHLQPQYLAAGSKVQNSLIADGCIVFGEVNHSVLSYGVYVGEKSVIEDSVIMPNVRIGSNVTIRHAIVGSGTTIRDGRKIVSQPQTSIDLQVIGDFSSSNKSIS